MKPLEGVHYGDVNLGGGVGIGGGVSAFGWEKVSGLRVKKWVVFVRN